ncbi:alpha/beta hydrolase [Streptomyces sp. NPDC088923]|uniref:alpha/beta hydrolase n=1 Tax=Streptomyces sp. NPDC088923 TaxID=3365913 RepID=UPI00382CE49B
MSHPARTTVRESVLAVDGERLSAYTVTPGRELRGAYGVVLLHGAGDGDKERCLPLAQDVAARGHHALALDFSGHGGSTGHLAELSLRRRRDQAAAVVAEVFGARRPLVLVGFSMSGQTVADLLARYGPRVAALALCAPGIYGRAAWDVPFGDGFTELIRRPASWRDSRALQAYGSFAGRALLVVPERDEVIPEEVTWLVQTALAARADLSVLRLAGAGHALGRWLSERPQARAQLLDSLLDGLQPPVRSS